MTTDRKDNAPAAFDWASLTKQIGADMRAADAKRAERMEGVSQGLAQAANRNASRYATKNYGSTYGSRKWASLW